MLSLLRRHSLSRIQYGIVNPKIYHGKNHLKSDRKIQLYPVYGLRNNRSAAIILNRPNYQNKLGLESMEEIYRFLRSFEVDENAHHIWIENKGYNSFSNGIDYSQLIKNPKYLHRIFSLGIMMSRINKPVLGYAKGLVGGTAAYLLKYLSSPFGDENTHIKFHDIDNHFVPICGGSYSLSRLNGQLGTYLALTGAELDANDMVGTGFIYGLLRRDMTQAQLRRVAQNNVEIGPRYFTFDTYDAFQKPDFSQQFNKYNRQEFMITKHYENESIMSHPNKDLRVARLAHVAYRSLQVEMQNIRRPFKNPNSENILNHFNLRESLVLNKFEKDLIRPHKGEVVRGHPLLVINRVFAHNTIEQIISALKKQGTEWANNVVKTLESKDPLALRLTLRLIRQAKKSTFPECLQREYRVASKLRLHQPFRKYHEGQNNTSKKQTSQNIQNTVNNFFNSDNPHHELQHDIAPYALLPVKQYRRDLPDAVRYFLNQEYWQDPNNSDQDQIVYRWLRRNQISLFNDSWSLQELRKRMYLHHGALLKMEQHWKKIDRLYYSHTNEKKFKDARMKFVDKVFADKQKVKELIEKKIVQNFDKQFNSRMEDLKPTAQTYSKEQKGKLYAGIRDILVKKRLTQDLQNKFVSDNNLISMIRFDPQGKGRIQNPTYVFKGTPFEHIIDCTDNSGKQIKPFPPEYYRLLDTDIDQRKVNPLITQKNADLFEVLRRYEQGFYFYKDDREDVPMMKLASEYCSEVKDLLDRYDPQQLKRTLHTQERYSWRHALKQLKQFELMFQQVAVANHNVSAKAPTFEDLYDLTNDNATIPEKVSIQFPQSFHIPQQLNERANKLLKLISTKIVSNFGDWYTPELQNRVPLLDNWVRDTLAGDINEFIKNDCLFIFSYFMIKDIEGVVARLGGNINQPETISKLQQQGIVFEDHQMIEPTFHKFVSDLIELYNTSVKDIVLKNTKLLQLHNRIKTNQEIQENSPSLDSFLIQLGRLRLKIKQRQNPTPTIFNYDTQFNLQTLGEQFMNTEDAEVQLLRNQLSITANSYDNKHKKLIAGFESYIERIDQMFKNINSTTDFLPECLLQMDNLSEFEKLTNDIDENEPVQQWFDRKLNQAIQIIFNHRLQAEKSLSQQQLKLFDQQVETFLQPAELKKLILQILENDISSVMSLKQQHMRQSDKGKVRSGIQTSRYIVNQDAFKKLSNLVKTMNIINTQEGSSQSFDSYTTTMVRLINQMTQQKPEKVLDEQSLQRANFTRNDRLSKFDTSNINTMRHELKTLTRIFTEDEDMVELSKILG